MALADTLFSSLQGGLYDVLQNVEKEYRLKFEEQENKIALLQKKVNKYENYDKNYDQIDDILDEIEQVEQKYDGQDEERKIDDNEELKDKEDEEEEEEEDEENDQRKTPQFWSDLESKFKNGDIQSIKELIRKNEIKMDDINPKNGRSLLMISTQYGAYELV